MANEDALKSNIIDLAGDRSKQVAPRFGNATSAIQRIIQTGIRETRREKLSYEQLKYCFKEIRRLANVTVPRKKQTLIELPTNEQLNSFHAVIKDPTHRLIFKTLEMTGLRISELCALEVRRIDWEQNQIFIHQGKGSKDRIALLPDKLKAQLQLYLSGRKNRYLFESARHDRYSTRTIQRLAAEYSEESGIEIWPHLLRHLYATRLLASSSGITESQLKILLGHSKNTDTSTYSHLSLQMVKANALEAMNQWSL